MVLVPVRQARASLTYAEGGRCRGSNSLWASEWQNEGYGRLFAAEDAEKNLSRVQEDARVNNFLPRLWAREDTYRIYQPFHIT